MELTPFILLKNQGYYFFTFLIIKSVGLVPLEEEKVGEALEYSTLPNFRVRILPGMRFLLI